MIPDKTYENLDLSVAVRLQNRDFIASLVQRACAWNREFLGSIF